MWQKEYEIYQHYTECEYRFDDITADKEIEVIKNSRNCNISAHCKSIGEGKII